MLRISRYPNPKHKLFLDDFISQMKEIYPNKPLLPDLTWAQPCWGAAEMFTEEYLMMKGEMKEWGSDVRSKFKLNPEWCQEQEELTSYLLP